MTEHSTENLSARKFNEASPVVCLSCSHSPTGVTPFARMQGDICFSQPISFTDILPHRALCCVLFYSHDQGALFSKVLMETKDQIRRCVRALKCFHDQVLMRSIKYGLGEKRTRAAGSWPSLDSSESVRQTHPVKSS